MSDKNKDKPNDSTDSNGADVNAIEAAEFGGREPGPAIGGLLFVTALLWSLFQLWIASPLPFWFDFFIVAETQARSIHLAFAVFLAFMAFPAIMPGVRGGRWAGFFYLALAALIGVIAILSLSRGGEFGTIYLALAATLAFIAWPILKATKVTRIPAPDWIFALVAAACSSYLYFFHAELSQRPGDPNAMDLLAAGIGLILLLEATRRVLGPALMIIAGVFLFYTFAGPLMPDLIAHRGAGYARAMGQQWLSAEGVFGIALGVSTSFVFLFVLFGALLERAGGGDYFIRVAFSLLGHMRGGPAKAAVVASGLTGVVSGSSIANVVTTGTFTVPLMKKVGFKAEKAAAIEVASSVNGQLMPPVMGAAAFLMVEYVGIPYVDVIKHAFLPAVIAYAALIYIVHLEALKAGMEGLTRRTTSTITQTLVRYGLTIAGFIVLAGGVYFGLGWIKDVAGDGAFPIIAIAVLALYLALLWVASRVPESHMSVDIGEELPEVQPTLLSGLQYLLPVVVLVWALVVERLSPGLSAFYATVFMIFIMITQRPILSLLRGRGCLGTETREGLLDLVHGMVLGARNMVGIGVATAAAGIIVGTVAMTGVGLVMTDLVGVLSGGNLLVMLVLVAVISLILGLGLPTTANYIIVATLMAPVIVELGAQNDLLIPLIAAHLFVFYFGIMADVTPPVGLASFAAAAVARADPIQTGVQAFIYSLRTVALPFIFVFNVQLLMIDITSVWHLMLVFLGALTGMLVFTAVTQGYFIARSRIWETALLGLAAFTLLLPGFWMDKIKPAFDALPATEIYSVTEDIAPGGQMRLAAQGINLEGQEITKAVMIPLGDRESDPRERLFKAGMSLTVDEEEGLALIRVVTFGSPAERVGLEGGWTITEVLVPAERPSSEWFFLPALGLVLIVWSLQRRRLAAG